MSEVVLHLPPISDDQVSNDLVWLTERLSSQGHEISGGFLGGEYGYGAYFENGTFMMHPFCWCERDDCPWCWGCDCPDEAYHHILADGTEVDSDAFYKAGGYSNAGARVDKDEALTCDYCRGVRESAPNFLHKPSGSRVSWYKYIGRSMETDLRADWKTIINECAASLDVIA